MDVKRSVGFAGEARVASLQAPLVAYHLLDEDALVSLASPQTGLDDDSNHWRSLNLDNYRDGLEGVLGALGRGYATFFGSLWLKKVGRDGAILDCGLVGHRVVTNDGVEKIASLMDQSDSTTGANFKYHGLGTTGSAESASQTGLLAELTTLYATANVRPGGSQTKGATVNIYRTAAIITVAATGSLPVSTKEHGVFSSPTVGSGKMLDRTQYNSSPISLDASESVSATYDLTCTAGG